MEPPGSFAAAPTKKTRPGRRIRKNSKPTDDSDFFNSNLSQNIQNGPQITTPVSQPQVAPVSVSQPSFQPNQASMEMNSQQGFYQPQPAQQQQQVQPGFMPQQNQNPNPNFNQNQGNQNQGDPNMNFIPNMMGGGPNNNMATGLMANMAMQYGDNLKSQGTAMVDKYLDSKSLKLYFQVDTSYVRRKLTCLILPFLHKDWSQRYAGTTNAPMSPKDDVNVPDLYIPTMALLTYVLLAGIIHGRSGSFDPEELGGTLSFGIGAILLEVLIVNFVTYITNLRTDMKTYDIVSYLGYKFVPVCFLLASSLLMPGLYWLLFAALSAACAFFLYKTLCLKINNPSAASNDFSGANPQISKKSYISMGVAALQPLLIYVLTYSF